MFTNVLMAVVDNPDLPAALSTALEKAFKAVAANVTDVIIIALPVGLGIMAITLSTRLGIRYFKSITKG